jgi:solute carrier family 25 folate transporter 32
MSLQNVALTSDLASTTAPITAAHPSRSAAYRNVFHGLRALAQEEGIRGYYKGFSATLLGMLHGAVVMTVYQQVKPSVHKAANASQASGDSGWWGLLAAASVAGALSKVLATVLTYPTQVIRTRMQDHRYYLATGQENHPGLIRIVSQIWRQRGLRGLYRGMSMQLVRTSLSNMVIFSLYETLQRAFTSAWEKAAKTV